MSTIGGHVVVVHPGPQEAQLVLGAGVASGERAQVLVDVLLALTLGKIERTSEPHRLGDLALEDLSHGGDPDRREHRGQVAVGD